MVENIPTLVGILPAIGLGMAFSWKSRQIIRQRDGNQCVDCGSTGEVECAHFNHDKTKPNYDDPSNGRVLCVEDHLKDHINRHGSNGLSTRANEWAINMIKTRLSVDVE